MPNEIYNKILEFLSNITQNTTHVPFWNHYEFWLGIGNVIVLAITVFWLIKYTRATEKMVENQTLPSVDVNMIYDNQEKKTYFWFLNASIIPALVSMKLKIKEKEHDIGPLRIAPNHSQVFHFKKTATSFNFLEGKEDEQTEAVLKILINPAIDNQKIKLSYTKNYKFNTSRKEWDESTWGYPDLPFPQQK